MSEDEIKLNSEHQPGPVDAGKLNKSQSEAGGASGETVLAADAREDGVTSTVLARADRVRRKHRSHRRRHSNHKHYWSDRSRLLLGFLGLILIANLIVAFFLGVQLYMLNKENDELKTKLARSQEELNRLKPELEKSLTEVQSLLKGQLPGLMPIEYDQVLTLNKGYLKNIIFNKVSSKNLRGYEFRIVMQNDTLATIWPQFKIHFFDEHGIHINSVQVSDDKESLMKVDPLASGEERSESSAMIKLLDNEKIPYFFLIRLN